MKLDKIIELARVDKKEQDKLHTKGIWQKDTKNQTNVYEYGRRMEALDWIETIKQHSDKEIQNRLLDWDNKYDSQGNEKEVIDCINRFLSRTSSGSEHEAEIGQKSREELVTTILENPRAKSVLNGIGIMIPDKNYHTREQRQQNKLSPESDSNSDTEQEIEQTDPRNQGSWDSLFNDSEHWNQVKKFWEGGREAWSKDKATVKIRNDENQHEFNKMQELKIPGRYIKNTSTQDCVYIPIAAVDIWTKLGKEYRYSREKLQSFRVSINKTGKYKKWETIKCFNKPDVNIHTPNNSRDYLLSAERTQISAERTQKIYEEIFPGKNIPSSQIIKRLLRGDIKTAGDLTRITELPHNEKVLLDDIEESITKKHIINTPIIWKNPENK